MMNLTDETFSSLARELATWKARAEKAEALNEELRMVVVKWNGSCSSSNQVKDTEDCIAGWNRRTGQAEVERDALKSLCEKLVENHKGRTKFITQDGFCCGLEERLYRECFELFRGLDELLKQSQQIVK